MASYNGRRAPNVSQYIATLNTIPSPREMAMQQQEPFNFEEDLAMFTNAQFFDFDMSNTIGHRGPDYVPQSDSLKQELPQQTPGSEGLEFLNGELSLPETFNFQDVMPNQSGLPPLISQPSYSHSLASSASPVSPPNGLASGPQVGEKRKSDAVMDPSHAQSLEEASRMAAEEDKRRRNTAASARFRIKKKQREQALERSAKEMSDKVSQLEARIGQLETENKWLKNLITEKNGKDDIAELWKKYKRGTASDKADSRSTDERKDGVGTQAKAEA